MPAAAILITIPWLLAAPMAPPGLPPLVAVEVDSTAQPAADSAATAEPSPAPAASAAPDTIVQRRERGGIPQRSWRALRYFAGDCGYVATSPFRLRALGLAELALVAGAEAAIYNNDQGIMDAAQRNHDQPELHAVHKLGDILEDAGFMPHTLEAEGGVWLLGAAFQSERTQQICQELIEAHLIGGGIRNAMKVLVGRAHPFEDLGPRHFEFGKGTSFPSGHTSIYYEAATVLSHHAHFWPATVVFYGVATAGAIQRVQARAHWASDVFLPIISGVLIGQTVVRRNEQRAARWQPRIEADGAGARLGVQRRF